MLTKWIYRITHLLLPNTCTLCGRAAQKTLAICPDCEAELPRITHACRHCAIPLPEPASNGLCGQCLKNPPAFDTAFSLFEYRTPVSQLIQSLKFHDKLTQARLLGTLLAQALATRKQILPDCIVPVPLSRARLRERGFNQSVELARPLSRTLKIPIKPKLLQRTRHTAPQSQLKFRDRHKNIRNAFVVTTHKPPAHIAIIDDVVTTASTCNEIARVLKKAGVKRVDVWCIARAAR